MATAVSRAIQNYSCMHKHASSRHACARARARAHTHTKDHDSDTTVQIVSFAKWWRLLAAASVSEYHICSVT